MLAPSPENAPLMPEKEHNAFSWIVVPMWACPFLRDAAYFYRFCVFYAKYHPLLCLAEAFRLGHAFLEKKGCCGRMSQAACLCAAEKRMKVCFTPDM